eukprot:CAMPEP_0176418816 /NCGR_PEP_ID=MMETSP0127-20121128/7693_1 /TAXON_ID=938130 /ORGANISM="Platyophrya macrostoma, Strain WH" /LENGTH=294 /DNA_ID=CAMNT_0017799207 /DNA_START=15 /DNA_END=899 /DNA_ORIENTATION=-
MENSTKRIVIVTGANKGIGYSLMTRLVKRPDDYILVLTSRNETLGKEAVTKLLELQPAIKENLHYHQLDISDSESISKFTDWVSKTFGKYDVLVNNAGLYLVGEINDDYKPGAYEATDFKPTPEDIKKVVGTNFFGTRALTDKLLPMLSADGKIINVSSAWGIWCRQGKTLTDILTKPDFGEEDLDTVYKIFENTCAKKSFVEDKVTNSTYMVSKAMLNAWTRYILVKQLKGDQQCYTMTPGWCKTDMGTEEAPRSVEQGSETLQFLIELPYKMDPQYNGKFFMDNKTKDFLLD